MAANPHRGEFELKLDGTTYKLKLGTEAVIAFQEACAPPGGGCPRDVKVLVDEMKAGRILYMRHMIWAGLQKYHSDLTPEAVSDIIDGANPEEVQVLLGKLGLSTQPAPEDLEALGINGRPMDAAPTEMPGRQTRKRRQRGGEPSTSPVEPPG